MLSLFAPRPGNISNGLTIGSKFDLMSEGLLEYAKEMHGFNIPCRNGVLIDVAGGDGNMVMVMTIIVMMMRLWLWLLLLAVVADVVLLLLVLILFRR